MPGRHRSCLAAALLLLSWLLFSAVASADDAPFPLERPTCASPRDTLRSFMEDSREGLTRYRRGDPPASVDVWFDRAEYCLDLSDVSADIRLNTATEVGLLLKEIINRAGIPAYAEIPGVAEVKDNGIEAWALPRTEISIQRVTEGERAGQFLFSPKTVARALEFYNSVRELPELPGYVPGNYDEFVLSPSYVFLSHEWARRLPAWAKATFYRNPVWKWLTLIVVSVIAVFTAVLVYRWGRRWDANFTEHSAHRRVGHPLFAVSLAAIPMVCDFVVQRLLGVHFGLQVFLSKLFLGIAFTGAVIAAFAILAYVAEAIIASRRFQQRGINANFVRLVARLVAIVLGLVLIIRATDFLGVPLAPLLAGLGIGGLAVALAARPTLENAIAGFIMFADKPVRVGDFCQFGEQSGTVEEIGLRSTRIRRLDDVLVVVPNGDLSQMQLQNYTQIRRRLYRTTLALRYETRAEQLRFVLVKLREMLLGHPMVAPDMLNVRFLGFGECSLDVEVFAYLRTAAWLEFRAVCEDLNLRIMDIVEGAGTGFAFPSQTAYFTRDRGLDPQRTKSAEDEVAEWRERGQLPFPEFAQDLRLYMEDTLDFPPRGSPDYKPPDDDSESPREQDPKRSQPKKS